MNALKRLNDKTVQKAGSRGQNVSDTVNLDRYAHLLKQGLRQKYESRFTELDSQPHDENDIEPDEFNDSGERMFVLAIIVLVLAVVFGDFL